MVRVLVTNDDGIKSPGIKALIKALALKAKVYVVAPDSQQSGKSHSISLGEDMIATKVKLEDVEEAYKLSGTPADCVKFGVQKFRAKGIEFDFVFSGINLGSNVGRDVQFSGTVGAAMEGAIQGIRSVALSMSSINATKFGYLCRMVPELMDLSRKFTPDIVLNVNAPELAASKVQGVKFVDGHVNSFNDVINQQDNDAYRYVGYLEDSDDGKSDVYYLSQGYVTVTPLSIDWADKASLAKLNGLAGVKSVCLLIDYQEKLVPAMRKSKELMGNVIKLAKCLDRLDVPVVVSQQYTRGLGNTVPELRKALGSYEKVEKIDFSCFGAPGFEEMFSAAVSRSVVIAGIESHICVLQTALDFIERGYNVTILKDCCSSRRKEDHETAMELLAARGCTITTWEAYVYMQMGSAAHSAFRAITDIVKE